MKNVIDYLKQNRKFLLLGAIWAGIFLVLFFLADIPLELVAYGVLLFAVTGGAFLVLDYRRFTARERALATEQEVLTVTLEKLPQPETPLEARYQQLLTELFASRNQLEGEYGRRYAELLDYYTMWVHQIKTPIAAMRLLLQSGEVLDQAELEEQLFKIEEYVGMVLQYLRMDDMGADLKIRQYSLDGIVRQAVRKYSRSFIRKKIRLDYRLQDCTVVTDEKWLVFVVEQLLSNAVKYTEKGTVSIYTEPSRPRHLVIEDTGIGIAAEDLPRIFEKGFTGYNGRTHKKSTGIGLYLCKTVLDKLNHRIRIESQAEKGTKVTLDLEPAALEID